MEGNIEVVKKLLELGANPYHLNIANSSHLNIYDHHSAIAQPQSYFETKDEIMNAFSFAERVVYSK